ncbi:MAG: alpha/beta hydrolase [Planctomycetota bacterium]|nr:alpha/beta hydrolase [Planctomycetota bacterium]
MSDSSSLLTTKHIPMSNGKRLRIARVGQGQPIVFLHGYPENLQLWCRLAPLLADRFEAIAFDWPGMGYSEAWPGGATPEHKAKQLLTILDELNLERPTIVGIDMGGQPALVFASLHPQRVQRLVVMNSLVFGDEKTSWEIRLLQKFGFNRFALQALPRIVFRRAERTFLPVGYRMGKQLLNDFRTAFFNPTVRSYISKMCAGYQGTLHQLPTQYERICCPTLVLWADNDKHFPVVQARRLNQTIPKSTLTIIPGTHWMPLNRAVELAEAIEEWIDSV